ncbi:MAG: 2-phosphosulfolactate phosphatase [Chloroflexi bacterium]|nr:2-phosphosulfolactate phosphatase [Chloroflexota bacterium]
MHIDVAFSPRDIMPASSGIAIVVDVIRATTSIVTLFEQGLKQLFVAPTLTTGRNFARSYGYLLCGEEHGARPEGFDYGNSPLAFSHERFDGQTAVLCTTNGTVALRTASVFHTVLAGCLNNARAACQRALELAHGQPITIVCSASYGHFAFDDAWTAGRLVHYLKTASPEESTLTDAARAALALIQAESDAHRALHSSRSARALQPLHLLDDVDFAARENCSTIVPELTHNGSQPAHPLMLTPDS